MVCCAVLVSSAGACQRGRPGPVPSPRELGADALPEGSTQRGLDVVYTGRTRPDCTELIALTPDGTAHHRSVCGGDDPSSLVEELQLWADDTSGDYAHRGDRLWVRTVAWDAITEELLVSKWEFETCATGLFDVPPADSQRVPFEFEVAIGTGPPSETPCR